MPTKQDKPENTTYTDGNGSNGEASRQARTEYHRPNPTQTAHTKIGGGGGAGAKEARRIHERGAPREVMPDVYSDDGDDN